MGRMCVYPKNVLIDVSIPSIVTIGDNCYINQYYILLTHDWITNLFLLSMNSFVNSSGRITIGNNVILGMRVMELKGITIGGDNGFIGAGSIVTNDISANNITMWTPCGCYDFRRIFPKMFTRIWGKTLDYVCSIKERFNRLLRLDEMREEFI